MQNFNTLKNYIQRLFKDFQAPYLFSSISSALNYFSKIKDFQGFPKHAMNPGSGNLVYTSVRLKLRSALQPQNWQLIVTS